MPVIIFEHFQSYSPIAGLSTAMSPVQFVWRLRTTTDAQPVCDSSDFHYDQFTPSDPTWQMPSFVASDGMNSERKCADKIGTVLVLWAGHFLR